MKDIKRIVRQVILTAVLFFPVLINAQFDIGIKGGYGYSRYFFQKDIINQNFLPVYNGGILFQYLNNKKLGIQSSIEFTQKGWYEETEELDYAKFKMDFLQFDFLSLFKFSSKKESGLFIKFGPYIAYSFSSQYNYLGDVDNLALNYDSLSTAYKKLDYGLKIGLSYKIKLKNGSLQLEMLYAQGLSHILERDVAGIFQSINQSLFINFAYTYTFGRKEETVKMEN